MPDGPPIDDSKVSITLTPNTQGTPNIYDDKLQAALDQAKNGGDDAQAYFDATNQTADYWTWMTNTTNSGEDPFAPGKDPEGNPIEMSSNGNLDMRMGAFWRGGDGLTSKHVAASDDPPIFGLATVQTHNTTSGVSGEVSFGLGLAGIPVGIKLTSALFADLIKPIYANMKTAVTKMATTFREAAEVESPSIDAEEVAEDPLSEATDEIEEVVGEEGVEYLAVDWGSVGLEAAGLGVLAAVPLIVGYLGHDMVNSVVINNLTDLDFEWTILDQAWGKTSVVPAPSTNSVIPKMDYDVDSWGDKTSVKVAYEARFQFINSNDFGSIGYVLGLQPVGGGTQAKLVTSIPWAGDNTIWVGESDDSPATIYSEHSDPDGRLSVPATFPGYQVTTSITKLSGKTDGQYFYGLVVVIEPA